MKRTLQKQRQMILINDPKTKVSSKEPKLSKNEGKPNIDQINKAPKSEGKKIQKIDGDYMQSAEGCTNNKHHAYLRSGSVGLQYDAKSQLHDGDDGLYR